MKMIKYLVLLKLLFFCLYVQAQVETNFNNEALITDQGRFEKGYKTQIDFELPAKNIDQLIETEKRENATSSETKPFQIAQPIPVDIDIANDINWMAEDSFVYGKFSIKAQGALSTSINFDKFYLPAGTEMYIYNENGNMITGPVTEAENNASKIWGSWVYKGEYLIIEIKTPVPSKNELVLHTSNIAYGYKEIYQDKVGGFGQSGACNINVLCPLGMGWEGERNSVGVILRGNGASLCTGAMLMNTCGTNQSLFLTANHCFAGDGNVGAWRFTFQAWSSTCTPSQNSIGVTFNGSSLRANSAASDFCLVELKNRPPANSNIHYAGWNRNATPAANATAIHHPWGDVMKISRANNAVVRASYAGSTYQHWRANWSPQNNGAGATVTAVTEPGSSGSPLFDENHRVIGQLQGGPSACGGTQPWDFYGSFDRSWTGGGTNATRLSNWLDPTGTGDTFTNTTNGSNLPQQTTVGTYPSGTYTHTGSSTPQYLMYNQSYYEMVIYYNNICSQAYTSMDAPVGTTVTWRFVTASPGSVYWYPFGSSNISVALSVNQTATFEVTYSNACGTGFSYYVGFRGLSCSGGYYYALSPNPAASNVTIKTDINRAKEKDAQSTITGVAIYDQYGSLKKQQKFGKVTEATINISSLNTGLYIIEITNDDYTERQQLSIQK